MRRHGTSKALWLTAAFLMALSLVVMYALGPRFAHFENKANDFYFSKQLIFTVAAILVLLIMSFSKKIYDLLAKFDRLPLIFLLASAFACLMLVILKNFNTPFVQCYDGACRAFSIPAFGSVQPAELFKLALIMWLPGYLSNKAKKGALNDSFALLPPLVLLMVFVLLVIALGMSDLGSTVVIVMIVAGMMLVAGVNWKIFRICIAAGIIALVGILGIDAIKGDGGYRMGRIGSWLTSLGSNCDVSAQNAELYHICNSKIGFGVGGLFGVGVTESVQTTGYLPEAMSDSIFAVIGECGGFILSMAVLLAYFIMLWSMVGIIRKTEAIENRLPVVGVFAWILVHVILNVGGMTGLLPMKGITLPFVSAGGSSLLALSVAYGIVIYISGWTRREVVDEGTSSWRRERGPRDASNRRRPRNLED